MQAQVQIPMNDIEINTSSLVGATLHLDQIHDMIQRFVAASVAPFFTSMGISGQSELKAHTIIPSSSSSWFIDSGEAN